MSTKQLKAFIMLLLGVIAMLIIFISTDAKKISADTYLPINAIGQVTNVSQFSDVTPNDEAYESVKNLVEKYGSLMGYPDGTFRGNEALTRGDFAVFLDSAAKQFEALANTNRRGVSINTPTKEDIASITKSLISLLQQVESIRKSRGTSPSPTNSPAQ